MLAIAAGCLVALAAGLLTTPLLRRLAIRLDITDRPDALLKPHARPTAYLGGVGFYLGWLAGLATVQLLEPGWMDGRAWLVAAAGGGIMLVGLADDIREVRPIYRLAAEAIAAVVLFIGGVRYLGLPAGLPDGATWSIALALQLALVVGACNSTNLLDGLDGLCGGVSGIVLAALAALAAAAGGAMLYFHPALGPEDVTRLKLVIALAVTLTGAVAAFLWFNYRPASIFMGDAGSLLLGLVIAACIALLGLPGLDGLTLAMGGFMAFGLPVGDAILAFVRRAVNRRPLFHGDRSHFYDQLVDRHLPVARVVNICYLASVALAAVGWVGAIVIGTPGWSFALYVAVVAVIVLLLWSGGFVRVDRLSKW